MAVPKKGTEGFSKFSKDKLKGAKKKEAFRQEKRQVRKETEAFLQSKKKQQKQAARPAGSPEKAVPSPEKATQKAIPGKKPGNRQVPAESAAESAYMPLNKYIAYGGICSRRDAAELVKEGKVRVNGKVVLEPSYRVQPNDEVKANGKLVTRRKNLVYILLNKPKDYITTAEDEKGRKTVLDIVKNATEERIYPVGRLDRNTTGVLLLTNDGDLAQQLTHPKFEVRKIYEVKLDKPVEKDDLDKLVQGINLEDGPIAADAAAYADMKDKSVVGIEIHSGRNRIVRRMFEHLGYDVRNLDRVMFANLTKKNVDRGKWRFLSEKEVRLLKYFNKSKK
ncbi:MAG: rRNA pseudouridine synthase [Chitinophagaceae bacterium]|nr:rRNA pseudouridine synthase [Chitinophagaceae bacterium]